MKSVVRLFTICLFFFSTGDSFAQCNINNATTCVCKDSLAGGVCDLLPDIKIGTPPFYVTGTDGIIEYSNFGNGPNDGRLRISVSTPNVGHGPLTVLTTQTFVCDTDTFFGASPGICPNGDDPKQLIVQRIYHKDGPTMSYYDRPAGSMTYHSIHQHMHVDDWGVYTLREATADPNPLNWPIIGTGSKLAFCLMDYGTCSFYNGHCTDSLGNTLTNSDFPNWGLGGGNYNCSAVEQGISSGYTDIYYQHLDGMWINLPPTLCNGTYWIVTEIDPYNYFLEENENNNVYASPITLTQQIPIGGLAQISNLNTPNICAGAQATLVANTGNSYLWSTGDTTQSITTSNPGNYTVTVSTPCGTATSAPYTLGISSVSPPTAVSDTVCVGDTAQLSATGNGIMEWYDQPGGTLLFSGTNFTTAPISQNTDFYVVNHHTLVSPSSFNTPLDSSFGSGNNHLDNGKYMTFIAYQNLELVSVQVYANGAGNRTITLRDAANTLLSSKTVYLPDGASRAILNFQLSPGGYRLGLSNLSNCNLFRNNSGVSYPYEIPGTLKITGSSAGTDYYYFFYNWEVKVPDVNCYSSPVTVTAMVDPSCITGLPGIKEGDVRIYPNPANDVLYIDLSGSTSNALTFTLYSAEGKTILEKSLSAGSKTTVPVESLTAGIYLVRLSSTSGSFQQKITIE